MQLSIIQVKNKHQLQYYELFIIYCTFFIIQERQFHQVKINICIYTFYETSVDDIFT